MASSRLASRSKLYSTSSITNFTSTSLLASSRRVPLPTANSQRYLHTSSPSPARWRDKIQSSLSKVMLGDRRERQLQRERGGLLPEEMRKLKADQDQQRILGSQSSDGEALIEEPLEAPVFTSSKSEEIKLNKRRLERQIRKRFGSLEKDSNGNHTLIKEHKFSTADFKISPRKLGMLASQIGSGKLVEGKRIGMPVDEAILQMQFSDKRAAGRIKSTLALARDHAIARGMNGERLVVDQAWVGKGQYMARVDVKGRGRAGVKHHPSARLNVLLKEGKTELEKREELLQKKLLKIRRSGMTGVMDPKTQIVNTYQRPGWAW